MTDRPNYATLRTDEATGLKYITDLATGRKLFKHPNCEVCGIGTYSISTAPPACEHHAPSRRERNDNEAAA
jgi:hypothetical protein